MQETSLQSQSFKNPLHHIKVIFLKFILQYFKPIVNIILKYIENIKLYLENIRYIKANLNIIFILICILLYIHYFRHLELNNTEAQQSQDNDINNVNILQNAQRQYNNTQYNETLFDLLLSIGEIEENTNPIFQIISIIYKIIILIIYYITYPFIIIFNILTACSLYVININKIINMHIINTPTIMPGTRLIIHIIYMIIYIIIFYLVFVILNHFPFIQPLNNTYMQIIIKKTKNYFILCIAQICFLMLYLLIAGLYIYGILRFFHAYKPKNNDSKDFTEFADLCQQFIYNIIKWLFKDVLINSVLCVNIYSYEYKNDRVQYSQNTIGTIIVRIIIYIILLIYAVVLFPMSIDKFIKEYSEKIEYKFNYNLVNNKFIGAIMMPNN